MTLLNYLLQRNERVNIILNYLTGRPYINSLLKSEADIPLKVSGHDLVDLIHRRLIDYGHRYSNEEIAKIVAEEFLK